MEKLTDLKYNPVLKQLLINYVYRMYEQDAITDDWHLWQEYLMLIRENRLNVILKRMSQIN
jgi:hypothetical protein